MSRVGLLCSEPLGGRVAGIGLRYLDLAERLPEHGVEVVLVSPGESRELEALSERLGSGTQTRAFERGTLTDTFASCQGVFGQGQLMNDLLLECPTKPAAVDLYDPWLIENLQYLKSLGLDPYRNDHASWILQLAAGDFFLCSSQEQRLFFLGFLTAIGRVNPRSVGCDPSLERLIAVAPFGVAEQFPAHRPILAQRKEGERRLLFGGLYDWYDPWPLLEVLERFGHPTWQVLFVRSPDPGRPQSLLERVEAHCRARSELRNRVQFLDWVAYDRRYDLLRDVDLIVSTHLPSVETELSMRTRFLDALAIGCPVVTSEGGAVSRLLREHGAGWVVRSADVRALERALAEALDCGSERQQRIDRGRELARSFQASRSLEPILRFCRAPWRDDTKHEFAYRPETRSPADPLLFRLRRRLKRLLKGPLL